MRSASSERLRSRRSAHQSIARWLAWYETLEPLLFTPEEEAAWQVARQENRQREKVRFEERAERLKERFE